MKLQFLPDGSFETPLIRLYDFTPNEAARLEAIFSALATKSGLVVDLHTMDFIEAVDNSRLVLTCKKWDQGCLQTAEPASFRCSLQPGTWDNIAGLTEPFTDEGCVGYQWLDETNIRLLLSCDGRW